MIIKCPQCSKSMEVPDDAEGKQTACPSCQHTFVIASPGPTPPVEARPAESPAPEPEASPAPPAPAPAEPKPELPAAQPVSPKSGGGFFRRRSIKELGLWRYIALVGGTLALVSFFTVWWGVATGATYPELGRQAKRFQDFQRSLPPENERTYQQNYQLQQLYYQLKQESDRFEALVEKDEQAGEAVAKKGKEFDKELFADEGDLVKELGEKAEEDIESGSPKGAVQIQKSFYGWDYIRGILIFIFAIIGLCLICVPMYVSAVRTYAWAFSFPSAALGLASAILALTFLVSVPTDHFKGKALFVEMTVREGSIMALAGSVVWAVFAAVDGAMSLVGKTGQRAR